MNILRLSTLSLTLAIAVMTLGYVNPASAAKPDKNCDPDDGPVHASCKPDDPPASSNTYTVELSGRVFHFGPPAVNVTPNGKETDLFPASNLPLTFTRPTEPAEAVAAWNDRFAACVNLFGGPTPIDAPPEFTAPPGNWEITRPGGVRFNMNGIPFDESGNPLHYDENGDIVRDGGEGPQHWEVNVQLTGRTFFDSPNDTSWLPVGTGVSKDYEIFDFAITGGTVNGVRPKQGCVSGGRAPGAEIELGQQPHMLKITAN